MGRGGEGRGGMGREVERRREEGGKRRRRRVLRLRPQIRNLLRASTRVSYYNTKVRTDSEIECLASLFGGVFQFVFEILNIR